MWQLYLAESGVEMRIGSTTCLLDGMRLILKDAHHSSTPGLNTWPGNEPWPQCSRQQVEGTVGH